MVSLLDIAKATGLSRQAIAKRAERESWPASLHEGRGGSHWRFAIDDLPIDIRKALAVRAASNTTPSEIALYGQTEGRKMAIADAIDRAARNRRREAGAAGLLALSDAKREAAEARLAVVAAFNAYIRMSRLPLVDAAEAFAAAYSLGDVEVPASTRALCPFFSGRTLRRWRDQLRGLGAAALAPRHGNRKGTSKIDREPELYELAVTLISSHPHGSAVHLLRGLRARFSGELALPSLRAVERWMVGWKRDNAALYTAICDPDAWKSRHMPAFGRNDEDVERLNQRWELDGSPADLLLADGKRHALVACLDLYSRRALLHVTRTQTAAAVGHTLRRAILAWGVPEALKTDNGSDYKSQHIERFCASIDLPQSFSDPFSPWQKGAVERLFRTFAHDLCELMPGYIGHNVPERQAIEARRSFADRLMKRGGDAVALALSPEELQSFCDRWCESIYQHQAHAALDGRTPFEVAASWAGEIRRVADPEVLSLLLCEAPSQGGWRTVGKRGISVEGIDYIAAELPEVGSRVRVLLDPEDLGTIQVYNDQGFVCLAHNPALAGVDRREIAIRARDAHRTQIEEQRRALKASAKRLRTKEIAEEILAHREAQASSLAQFPQRSTEHRTAGIEAAEAARDASTAIGNRNAAAPYSDNPWDDGRELPPVDDAAMARLYILMRDEQRQEETAEDRFKRWIRIEQAREQGSEPCETDRHWLKTYEITSEYRARRMVYDEWGAWAFGMGER